MKQILQNLGNGDTALEEVPVPESKPGSLLIATSKSLVSAGTERMLVDFGKANLLAKARQQPDKVKMVLDKIRSDGPMGTLSKVDERRRKMQRGDGNLADHNLLRHVGKKIYIVELHAASKKKGLYPLLEISTKSDELLGQRLSAFNLKIETDMGEISVEAAFQGSKVFEQGGPFTDIYRKDSYAAKIHQLSGQNGCSAGVVIKVEIPG